MIYLGGLGVAGLLVGVVLLLGEAEAEHAQGVAVSRLGNIGEVISLSGQTL